MLVTDYMNLYVFYCTMHCSNPAFGCQILINFLSSCLAMQVAYCNGFQCIWTRYNFIDKRKILVGPTTFNLMVWSNV